MNIDVYFVRGHPHWKRSLVLIFPLPLAFAFQTKLIDGLVA
jgi:hypothetical protein